MASPSGMSPKTISNLSQKACFSSSLFPTCRDYVEQARTNYDLHIHNPLNYPIHFDYLTLHHKQTNTIITIPTTLPEKLVPCLSSSQHSHSLPLPSCLLDTAYVNFPIAQYLHYLS